MSGFVPEQRNDFRECPVCEKKPTNKTVTDLLRLREESEHPALICGDESISYKQLAADAKKIALCLLEQGLRKGDRILLTVSNSIHVVRAIYGILLAGGVYVAADVKWPEKRLRLISEEAGISGRITDEMILEFLRTDSRKIPLPMISEEDEAAVYYTSGSTGTPKGTILHHRILIAYADPAEMLPEYTGRDRFLTIPVFTSIIPVFYVFLFTAYEKTLVLTTPQEMTSIDRLADCVIRNRVQCIGGTPSFLLHALADPSFAKVIRQQVTHLWACGELLKESDARKMFSAMEKGVLGIGYGMSEEYCLSMSRYEPGKEICLERFPKGNKLYVLDWDMKPVSNGEKGEIVVGGVCAQYGHYLDPERNREKYTDHPKYGRLFRTGDAGRLNTDGTITVLGRLDRMIKLHGFRIEPGEVEAAMEQYNGISRAAVVLKEGQLCGYYTAESETDENTLRKFLSEWLPYYMIPSVIIRMESFPMSGNVKLDYNALPDPQKCSGSRSAPENDRERLLCRIFGEILKTGEPVGAKDSFFSLGGDSLRALMVMGELEKEGFSLEMKDFFTAPTPRLLAPLLQVYEESSEQMDAGYFKADTALKSGEGFEAVYPVTRHIESRFQRQGSFYPVILTGEIDASISEESLKERIMELSEKHDALRSQIVTGRNGEPVQVVQKQTMTEFFHVDLRKLSKDGRLSDSQKRYLASLIRMELSEGTELGRKAAFRLGHIRISEEKAVLTCGFSHYILDGTGIAVILRELLDSSSVSPDRTLWQRRIRRLSGEGRDQALAYWKNFFNQIEDAAPFPQAPDAAPFPQASDAYSVSHPQAGPKKSFFMTGGQKRFEALKKSCAEKGTTLSILMTYAIGRALLNIQGTESVLFYTMETGRNASEMQLPGMFTVSFPVYMKKNDSPKDLQRQLIRSERHAWVFGLPDAQLPSGDEYLQLNVQNLPLPKEFRPLFPTELEDPASDPEKSLWSRYFAVTDTSLEIQAYPDERFGFMGWCDTGQFDAEALKTLMREALKELKLISTENI